MTQARRDILVFEIEGQRFGLPVEDVRELLRAVTITPLPRAPAVVEGVIDVRGTVVPVLDIRRRFRLPPKPPAHTDHLIVAVAGGRPVALRVDHALELALLDEATVDQADAVLPGVEYIAAVAKCPAGLVLIHDLYTFLSASEAALLSEALAAEEGLPP